MRREQTLSAHGSALFAEWSCRWESHRISRTCAI